MAFILVKYKVEDYKRWKTAFDDAFEMRKDSGEKNCRIFQCAGDHREMVLLQEWDSLSSARRFTRSRKLRQCMERSGVISEPEMVFLKEIPHYQID